MVKPKKTAQSTGVPPRIRREHTIAGGEFYGQSKKLKTSQNHKKPPLNEKKVQKGVGNNKNDNNNNKPAKGPKRFMNSLENSPYAASLMAVSKNMQQYAKVKKKQQAWPAV